MRKARMSSTDAPVGEAIFSFGEWVRLRRKALRLSRQEVADAVACSAVLIAKIETDARRPSVQIAERLAHTLQIPPSDMPHFVRVARAHASTQHLPTPAYRVAAAPTPSIAPLDHQPAGNLPAAVSSFIGRSRELAEVRSLLLQPDVRLLTLTGPGGSGKTRLALEAARAFAPQLRDGAWFIDLAPITEPSQAPAAILQAVGVAADSHAAPRDTLLAWARAREALLLFDNFEHLLTAAPLVNDILRAAPRLRALVTSRVALRLQGEQEYRVEPLSAPETTDLSLAQLTTYDAVQLFTARARAVDLHFQITPAHAASIAAICMALDGLPLAIELAAARIRLFTPPQLLARLRTAALPQLTGGARDLPDRQQTMSATIAWSCRLLSPGEQRLFPQLAVFTGGWSIEALEQVCRPQEPGLNATEALATFVEHHLVRRSEHDGEARFSLYETIREYALEQLRHNNEEEIRRRHAEYYVTLAERLNPECWWPPEAPTNVILDREIENMRAVLRWSLAEPETGSRTAFGLRLMIATHLYWEVRGGRAEGHQWLSALYDRVGDQPQTLRIPAALALAELRKFYDTAGAQTLIDALEPWMAIIDAPYLRLWYECSAGWTAYFCDAFQAAIDHYTVGLELAREYQDRRWEAENVVALGVTYWRLGELERSEALLRAGAVISRAIDWQYEYCESLHWQSYLFLNSGRNDEAYAVARECLQVARQIGNQRALMIMNEHIGLVLLRRGQSLEAEAALRAALTLARQHGNTRLIESSVLRLAQLAAADGRLEHAESLLREADELAVYIVRPPAFHLERQVVLARIHLARRRTLDALLCLRFGLSKHQTMHRPYSVAVAIEIIAAIAAQRGDVSLAARLWGAAEALRSAHEAAMRPEERFTADDDAIAGARAQLGEQAWERAAAAGRALTWREAADAALAWLRHATETA
jgi:non-specific serine/threonine protein kinase